MQFKDIATNPAMLDAFKAKAETNLEEAVRFARDAGYKVNPAIIPTPATDRRREAIARGRGGDGAATIMDIIAGRSIASEAAAVKLAQSIWEEEAGPLAGLSTREQVTVIMNGQSGLSPLAAFEKLVELDEHPWAREFQGRHGVAIERESEARDRVAVSLEKLREEEQNARTLAMRPFTDSAGNVSNVADAKLALDAVAAEFAMKRKKLSPTSETVQMTNAGKPLY